MTNLKLPEDFETYQEARKNAFLKMNYLAITVIQSVSLSAREAEIPQPRPESVPLIFPALPVLFLRLP